MAKVKRSQLQRFTVQGYGGKTRRVARISDTGLGYKGGDGWVPIRWVLVHDLQGTHRDEFFYTTDPAWRPDQIVSLFTGRWSIEVTFQEVRTHLGFTTPRNGAPQSVLRTAPCLFGLFSRVSLIFAGHVRERRVAPLNTPWYPKKEATFSDAITAVRRWCWETVLNLKGSPIHAGVTKLPERLRLTLLNYLSRAA